MNWNQLRYLKMNESKLFTASKLEYMYILSIDHFKCAANEGLSIHQKRSRPLNNYEDRVEKTTT